MRSLMLFLLGMLYVLPVHAQAVQEGDGNQMIAIEQESELPAVKRVDELLIMALLTAIFLQEVKFLAGNLVNLFRQNKEIRVVKQHCMSLLGSAMEEESNWTFARKQFIDVKNWSVLGKFFGGGLIVSSLMMLATKWHISDKLVPLIRLAQYKTEAYRTVFHILVGFLKRFDRLAFLDILTGDDHFDDQQATELHGLMEGAIKTGNQGALMACLSKHKATAARLNLKDQHLFLSIFSPELMRVLAVLQKIGLGRR